MTSQTLHIAGPDSGESGFGLIEIVISMFLLALLSLALLPLLLSSMQTSVRNSTIATATQLVNQHMEQARAAGDTCTTLNTFGGMSPLETVTDDRGVLYEPTRTVECPAASYPGTVRVTVSVSILDSTVLPVSATTLIFVTAP